MRVAKGRCWVFLLGFALLLPQAASATWSIAISDSETGELAIGSATCVTGIDLKRLASVVVVGKGAGAAQSSVDVTGQNRMLMFQELMNGTSPEEILIKLAIQDPGHQTRQYGIVDTQERSVGFTGSFAGGFAGHLTGRMGTITYAVQGNLLTGASVLTEAEAALRDEDGDLPARLMAAMLAAREQGGDGRCSCSPSNPQGCGAPPPSFQKAAHVGYMVAARRGDQDGTCNAATGCANGSYFMDLNVAFQGVNDEDAVLQLEQLFADWRQTLVGRPDHNRSQMLLLDEGMPANGVHRARGFVIARDWLGVQIRQPGATVTVDVNPSSTAGVSLGPILDRGEGLYLVRITSGVTTGKVILDVTIDYGSGPVLLSPSPVIEMLSP